MNPMDYFCQNLMRQTVCTLIMCCICQVQWGGPLFVAHGSIHAASLDTHAGVLSLGQKYPWSFGDHPSTDERFSAHFPPVVIHDPVPVSKGTQIRDKQGHQQQPHPHCAGNKCWRSINPKATFLSLRHFSTLYMQTTQQIRALLYLTRCCNYREATFLTLTMINLIEKSNDACSFSIFIPSGFVCLITFEHN